MVLPDSHRVPRVPWYSGISSLNFRFRIQDFHLLWFSFPTNSSSFHCRFVRDPTTPKYLYFGLGSSAFARRYLRNHSYFLLLRLLRWFSSPGSPPYPIYSDKDTSFEVGFPIRISTSQRSFDSSSWLFAVFYVLLRLLLPRHPPYTSKKLSCHLLLLSRPEPVSYQLPFLSFQ